MDAAHSPISRRRSPPHVVFLVDTQLTENGDISYEQQAIDIRFGILRVLLYFYTCIDRRMTWGYQFFDSENSSSTLRLQNHFQELSISALDAFFNAFTSELEVSFSKQRDKFSSAPDDESPFARLKQALAQALSDFQWNDIDVAYLASPGRLRRTPRSMRQMRNGPLETRNHIYVISSIPQSYSDLMWYFHGRSETAVQTHLTREGDKMKIVKLMDNAAMEMRKTLWDGFIDHRIALNWMDLRSHQIEDLSGEDEDIQRLIGTSFQAIAKIFGGYLIPFSLLQQDRAEYYGYSIQSILCHYTSKTIDTSNQFARNRKGNITKPSLYDITQGIEAVRNVAWTGDLILNEELLTQGASKINLLVHNLLRPQLSNALIEMAGSEADSVVSVENRLQNITSMKGFLLLPAAYIPVKWHLCDSDNVVSSTKINEHFLCTFNHDGDTRALSEFETLISTMNHNNQVLIVRLEFQDVRMEGYEYAIIQPLARLCATIGFLKCETDELLALARFDQTVESTTGADGHGTTIFDPWASTGLEFFGDEVDESLTLFSIDTHMPAELKTAIATEAASQSVIDSTNLTMESLSLTTNEMEIGGLDVPEILDGVVEINDKPASLEEFQSYWIEMYLPSLYQTSIEPEIIAGRLQTWVNYLEHSVKISPTDILNALKLLPMSFHSFDAKHKEISNASGIITDELAPHLVDDEVDFLQNWKQARQLDSKSLRILKIKDAQLQIVVMLKIMELEKRFMTLNKIELPKPQKRKTKKKKAPGKEDLDQQLELYFERLCIWDSMMDTTQSANNATTTKLPQKGTDDTILQLRVLCKCLSDIYRPILPDTIDKLWSRCGGEEELLAFETGRTASSASATKAALFAEKSTKSNKKLPMDVDARVKLLESRIRGPSTETAVTDAAWATKSDNKSATKSIPTSSNVNFLSGSRKAPSSTINLPFMKREIEMTKSLSSSSKGTKVRPSNMPSAQSKSSGSRRKITTPKKIPMAIMDGRNTETVVLRKRTALSPTTPRTRAERDFGLRLARTPTKSPSFVPMAAKRSTDGIDGPVLPSPRKLMRTLTGSRSPTAQRHRTSLPLSRIRLSPSSPSHNRIKQTKPADLTEIAPKRDLFTSFLQASTHSNSKDESQ